MGIGEDSGGRDGSGRDRVRRGKKKEKEKDNKMVEPAVWRGGLEGEFRVLCKMEGHLEVLLELSFYSKASKIWIEDHIERSISQRMLILPPICYLGRKGEKLNSNKPPKNLPKD
jgi:hypothetical protein